MLEDENTPETQADEPRATLTDWAKEPTIQDLQHDFVQAKSAHDSQQAKINGWLDLLHITGSAKKKFPKGRSTVQPQLIRKQAEWRKASLAEPLLSTQDLFDVAPVTAEDKKGALQNQMVLNYQFSAKIDKQKFVDSYVETAVHEGTVILRTGWSSKEKELTVTVDDYEYEVSLDPAYASMILQGIAMKQQMPAQFMSLPEDLKESVEYSMTKGNVPHRAMRVGSHKEKRMVTVANHPTVEVCNFANVYFDPTCGNDLDKAQYVIYTFETTLAELRAQGIYENLDNLRAAEGSAVLERADHEVEDKADGVQFADEPRKKVVVHEYWGFWDYDGDGEVEPFVASWIGNTLIRMEENPFPDKKVPFVVVPYIPTRNDLYGIPDAELLKDNQDIIGAVTRGMIDIMGKSAAGQKGIRKDALDVPNRRRYEQGLDYEFNPTVDPRTAIIDHNFPEISQSAAYMLDMQNQDAESLTGVKAFASGISGQALGDTATAVRGALDAASKRELGILRRLAKGLEEVGRKFIAMNSEFLDEEEIIRVTAEEFVPIRRDDLAGNYDLNLSVSTAEADNQKAQELAFMLQTMGNNLPFEITQLILADIARLRKMPSLAKRLEEFKPEPDPTQQLEMQKLQIELAKLQAETQNEQADTVLTQAKTQTEAAKARELGASADLKALDYVEEELGVNHERDIQKIQAQAKANTNMKIVEAALSETKPENNKPAE